MNAEKPDSSEPPVPALPEESPVVPGKGADPPGLGKRLWPVGIVVLCLALFVFKAVSSMVEESATWDETHYFGLGKHLLVSGQWDVFDAVVHPPLSYYIQSIPLLFFPTDEHLWQIDPLNNSNRFSHVLRGQALLANRENRGNRLLNLSRLTSVLTAVLLGWFMYIWSYSLYGRWSALLAVVLFSFSPNILAQARLITPDIALTTFSFITLFYFWRLLRNERMSDAIVGGLFLGLALLSKFTSLLLGPICLALMILWRIKQKRLHVRPVLAFALIGIGILCLGYGFHLRPYFVGILIQLKTAGPGVRHNYLMGRWSSAGWWYYFVVVFVIKTPIAAVILLTVAAMVFVRKVQQGQWLDEAFLLLPAAAVFCFFSLKNVQIGVRYILPIYPLLFVFASQAGPVLFRSKLGKGLCLAAVTWHIGASCYIHPHYLAYFNELIGGPDNGANYLVDSNIDWGQDLMGLKEYMDKHGIARISLSYFGADSPERYGIVYDWLPSFYLRDPDPDNEGFKLNRWVAISATNLEGLYYANKDPFAWFRTRKPVAKIGYSIFIYELNDQERMAK